jgi:hypothetical protein
VGGRNGVGSHSRFGGEDPETCFFAGGDKKKKKNLCMKGMFCVANFGKPAEHTGLNLNLNLETLTLSPHPKP